MRAFVAIPVPDDLTDRLEDIAAGVRFGRAVPCENMHVTLAFLGDQPEPVLAELHEELSVITPRAPRLSVAGLDLFGGDKPRLLFAALAHDDALDDLRKKVRQAARSVGIILSHERFRPHISLRRFHRLGPGQRIELDRLMATKGAFTWPEFCPGTFDMVESTLTRDSAQYHTLARYPLTP